MAEPMTPERLEEIREAHEKGLLTRDMVADLLAEVDRLRAMPEEVRRHVATAISGAVEAYYGGVK